MTDSSTGGEKPAAGQETGGLFPVLFWDLAPPIFLNAPKVNRIKADSYKRYNGRDDL